MFTTTFGPLLKALLEAFNVPPEHAGRIEGRIKNLRRENLLGTVPTNKNGDSLFSPIEINKLILALALAHAGLPPREIITLINDEWETLAKGLREADAAVTVPVGAGRSSSEIYLMVFNLNLLVPDAEPPNIIFAKAAELRQLAPLANPSATVLNLSKTMRRFHAAFVKHHDLSEPVEIEPLRLPDPERQPPKRK
jgi:hypothetical protein